MASRPINKNGLLKATCRTGTLDAQKRRTIWLQLLNIDSSKRAEKERRDDYEEIASNTFGSRSVPTGFLAKLPLLHVFHRDHTLLKELKNSSLPEATSPEAKDDDDGVRTSGFGLYSTLVRDACVLLVLLQRKTLCLYAGSVFHLAMLLLEVLPPHNAFAALVKMTNHSRNNRGSYYFLRQTHERAAAIATHELLTESAKGSDADVLLRDSDIERWHTLLETWQISFFADVLPSRARMHLMDCFLSEGRKVLVRLSLIILSGSDELHACLEDDRLTDESIRRFQRTVRDMSSESHAKLMARSFKIRNFKRKTLVEAFNRALQSLSTVSAASSLSRQMASWERELHFRSHHLNRRPLQLSSDKYSSPSVMKESEIARAIPCEQSSSKTKDESNIARTGSEGYICPMCRCIFRNEAELLVHSKRHEGGIWGASETYSTGILLSSNDVLSRLRWWRLKEIVFNMAGSLVEIENDPVVVYSTRHHGYGLDNLEDRWDRTFGKEKDSQPPLCIVLVQTSKGEIFGAITSSVLKRDAYCGRSDASVHLFSVLRVDTETDRLVAYPWQSEDATTPPSKSSYALLITDKSFVIGGGVDAREAVYLSSDFQSGHSKACASFRSPPLVDGTSFNVSNIEVLSVCRREV